MAWRKHVILLQGVEVTCMAWDPDNTATDTTGTLLFGSNDGQVCEAVIEDRKEKKCIAVSTACSCVLGLCFYRGGFVLFVGLQNG